nr:MAG TPA: hypothetical protein [Caudoviricetes sp.]
MYINTWKSLYTMSKNKKRNFLSSSFFLLY